MLVIIITLFSLIACGQPTSTQKIQKVGLLIPDNINDQVWGTKGYKGLLKIQSQYKVDVFYKEGIVTDAAIKKAVRDFHKKGVNLIFGHGSEYADVFNKLAVQYPEIHFIGFNGNAKGENVTSLNFKSSAMGFFGGMVAGKMTKTNKVGVIAAFEWQPEVNGFFEGAAFQNQNVEVKINFIQDWNNVDRALNILDEMIASGVDVVYPAGDGFNVPVIEKLKEQGLYAIGFVSDQSDLGEGTVLTSTVQHVADLYLVVAEEFNKGNLKSGNLYFDFQEEVISLGKFSPNVDKAYQEELKNHITRYKETGKLPNE
ncbi:BMP family ABC transporter substrate-binding protein [Bacillus timonensis]|nr:BMP family ABC transporter substrate-binding protein [Bacillus timonensis]